MVELMKETYSNVKVVTFNNPADIAGGKAVYFLFTGDDNESGQNNTVCHIILFSSVNGKDCEQQFNFTYKTGANSSLETNLNDIIKSISLKK